MDNICINEVFDYVYFLYDGELGLFYGNWDMK